MGFLNFGSEKTGETQSKTKLPGYLSAAAQDATAKAKALADQPYTSYGGRRVISRTPNEKAAASQAKSTQAMDVASGSTNRAMNALGGATDQAMGTLAGITPYYQGASQAVNQGINRATKANTDYGQTIEMARAYADPGGGWNAAQRDRYMSPYIEGVIDPTIRRINEEAQLNAIGGRYGQTSTGGVGAFGDARTAMLEGQMEEARLRGVKDATGEGYASAYESALAAYDRDRASRLAGIQTAGQLESAQTQAQLARAGMTMEGGKALADIQTSKAGIGLDKARTEGELGLKSAAAMGELGLRSATVQGALGSQRTQDLMQTGGLQRAVQQAGIDAKYLDFLEQRDWDARGLNYYISALAGIPAERETTTEQKAPVMTASGALGLGVTAASLWALA